MQTSNEDSIRPDPEPEAEADSAAAGLESADTGSQQPESTPKETGGPKGPEPTRYGDWERKGRCIDF